MKKADRYLSRRNMWQNKYYFPFKPSKTQIKKQPFSNPINMQSYK